VIHVEKTYVLQLAGKGVVQEVRAGTVELEDLRAEPDDDGIRVTVIGQFDRDASDERMHLYLRSAELRELIAAANEVLDRADAEDLVILHGLPRDQSD
jgi:hypothetical protein